VKLVHLVGFIMKKSGLSVHCQYPSRIFKSWVDLRKTGFESVLAILTEDLGGVMFGSLTSVTHFPFSFTIHIQAFCQGPLAAHSRNFRQKKIMSCRGGMIVHATTQTGARYISAYGRFFVNDLYCRDWMLS
jgi:hypothetical protein